MGSFERQILDFRRVGAMGKHPVVKTHQLPPFGSQILADFQATNDGDDHASSFCARSMTS